MHAYNKSYLLDVINNVGEATDFAANTLNIPLQDFWHIFASSKGALGIENGMPWALVGLSGVEHVLRACEQAGYEINKNNVLTPVEQAESDQPLSLSLSCEYWCGYSLAILQWFTRFSFARIETLLPIVTVADMYTTFHEESEERFIEASLEMMQRSNPACGLKQQRELLGLSQSQLAKKAGVGIRAIQQYEQGAKHLNRASYETVDKLARALCCKPQDLMYEPSQFEYVVIDF